MKRRNSESYAREMLARLPPGPIWPRDLDGVFGKLLLGASDELGRVNGAMALLLDEWDPRTTDHMLGDFEQAYGLPDPCVAAPVTIEERRKRLMQLYAMKGKLTPRFIAGIAYDLGYDVLLEEFEPAACGITECGSPLDGEAWRWAIFVHSGPTNVRWMECGESDVGELLSDFGNASLECVLPRHVPVTSRPRLIFGYDEPHNTFGAASLWSQPGPASGVDTPLAARPVGATYFLVGTFAAEAFGGSDAAYGLIASSTRVSIGASAGGDMPRVTVPIAPAGKTLLAITHEDVGGVRKVKVRMNGALVGSAEAAGTGAIAGDAIAFTAGGLDHLGLKLWPLGDNEIDWLERVLARQFAIPLASWPVNLAEGA